MPDIPQITKDVRLLAPKRPTAIGNAVLIVGTALASIGVLGSRTVKADVPTSKTAVVRMSSSSSLSVPAALLLAPPNGIDVTAQHRSHASHASHYSSAGGSLPRATAPPDTKAPSKSSPTPNGSSKTGADSEHATVAISSLPSFAEIEVDGKYMGST